MCGGDITLSFYTQDIRVLGIRTPPPTSLGLATPLLATIKEILLKKEHHCKGGGVSIIACVSNVLVSLFVPIASLMRTVLCK